MNVAVTPAEPHADLPAAPALWRRALRWIGTLLVAVALLGLLWTLGRAVGLFIEHGRAAVEYPFTLNYGEGPLLEQSTRLVGGENIYRADLSTPPYTITNYPPLYVLVQAPFVRAYGGEFWYGRLISLVSTGAAALFLGLTGRALTRDWIAGIAAGGLLLAVPYLLHWSALARIDSLALAFSWAGLWLVVQFPSKRWALLASILLLASAAYTRQTYLLAAPLASVIWLWRVAGFKRALAFGAWLASLVLAIFAVLLVTTEGGVFYHLITANVNPLDGAILQFYADEVVRALPVLLACGGALLILGLIAAVVRRTRSEAKGWFLAAPYLIGALAAALTIAKVGSDVNYLYELSAGLCLAAGVWVGWLKRLPALRAALLVGLYVQVLMLLTLSEQKYIPIQNEKINQRAQNEALATLVATTDAPIIADEHMGLLALNHRPIPFQPFEMTQLAHDGLWDQTPFLWALARGDYPVLLMYQPYRNPRLRFERWTPEMLRVINEFYRFDRQAAETMVYRHILSLP
jgi:hypothetical protein